jgi:hypothetical protein
MSVRGVLLAEGERIYSAATSCRLLRSAARASTGTTFASSNT